MSKLAQWLFRDRRDGGIVIAQWPNWPLALFAVAVAAQWILQETRDDAGMRVGHAAGIAASPFLTWWSLDEIMRGVNPWRRFLGMLGLIYAALRTWQLL